MPNLVVDMKLVLLFFSTLLCKHVVGQCVMQIVDTVHVDCFGENTGSFTLDVVAESPYTITLGTGQASIDGNGFSNLMAGNYQIVLMDNQLCTDTLELKIKEPAELTADIRCEDNNLVAYVEGGVLDYSISWVNELGEFISDEFVIPYQSKQFYDLIIVDSKGCSVTDTIFVSALFSVADSIGQFPFEVFIDNNSYDSYEFNWDFGDGTNSSAMNPIHSYEAVGNYKLELSVQDEHSCSDQTAITIDVQGFEMSSNDWQEMPNVFSPNGDGINDQFSFLENHAIVQFRVQIFNRWGSMVYSWTDPKGAWSGVDNNGQKLVQGVYYYQMEATGLNGLEYSKTGAISLY